MVKPIWLSDHDTTPDACRWSGCRSQAMDDTPLCERHFTFIGVAFAARNKMVPVREALSQQDPEGDERDRARKAAMQAQSQVYYVRIGEHIKIGYSINMRQRIGALRVPHIAVLATEPGGRALEKERHEQFRAERISRREDFIPSERLMRHIAAIKAQHGPPRITDYRTVRRVPGRSA